MHARRWQSVVGAALVALSAAACAVAAVACAGTPASKFASVKAGPLPAGESWTGVYYNPVYGYLHLVEQDGNVVGRWKRTDGSHWGELSGKVDGNVARFTWKEYRVGAIDPSGQSEGSGMFVYKLPAVDHPIPELEGQYALSESSSVGDWHCVKQVGMRPDLSSINGNSATDAPAASDHWQ